MTHASQSIQSQALQPDPEGMNDSRAEWAEYAIAAFISLTGTEWESAVTDLLCNLMHQADRAGTDFEVDLKRARMHYDAETTSTIHDHQL